LPGATQLVYDNYNALVIGFGPSEKTSHAIFSIAMYPRWLNLFFLQAAATLPDPQKLLKGSGSVVRHIVIQSASELDQPAVQKLMTTALNRSIEPIDPAAPGRLVIRSISAKQRPRRPK
jgi:hypothetical protein